METTKSSQEGTYLVETCNFMVSFFFHSTTVVRWPLQWTKTFLSLPVNRAMDEEVVPTSCALTKEDTPGEDDAEDEENELCYMLQKAGKITTVHQYRIFCELDS